jgi:hypothetical protein
VRRKAQKHVERHRRRESAQWSEMTSVAQTRARGAWEHGDKGPDVQELFRTIVAWGILHARIRPFSGSRSSPALPSLFLGRNPVVSL